MWQKSYRDYKNDDPLKKHTVETGKGIVGCEMNELNGWGESWHVTRTKKTKKGLFRTMLESLTNLFKH